MTRNDWMWAEALDMLARAERAHRQMFHPTGRQAQIAWEPPADVLETERDVLVLMALPGVDVAEVDAAIQDGRVLVVSGRRILPPELQSAVIHRLELPQGYFERRISLPPGRYGRVTRAESNGCLVIRLSKALP
jgi:HSP20 family protein